MTFKNPSVVPSTRPHFKCEWCNREIWREGGISTAQIHGREVHGHDGFQVNKDFELTTMKPTFYRGPLGNTADSRRTKTDGWAVNEGN